MEGHVVVKEDARNQFHMVGPCLPFAELNPCNTELVWTKGYFRDTPAKAVTQPILTRPTQRSNLKSGVYFSHKTR